MRTGALVATNSSSRIAEAADGLAAALARAPVAEVRGAAVAVAAEGRRGRTRAEVKMRPTERWSRVSSGVYFTTAEDEGGWQAQSTICGEIGSENVRRALGGCGCV